MNKTVKIYAVMSSRGSYDDYFKWIEKCFTNRTDAEEYAKIIDASHEYKSRITDDLYSDIDRTWYNDAYKPAIIKFCRDNGIPANEEQIDLHKWSCDHIKRHNKMVCEFANKIEEQHDEWCIKYLIEHYPEYTEKDYWDYIDKLEHSYEEWHSCEIKELECVVNDDFKIE